MKKLFFLALLAILCKCAPAQTTTCVWYSTDTITIGDSAWVDIKYSYSTGNGNMYSYIYLNGIPNTYDSLISYKTYYQLDNLPRHYVGTDLMTRINFIVPSCVPGTARYLSSCTLNVFVKDRTLTSVETIKNNKTIIHSEFYDLTGQKIQYIDNAIILRLDYYSDGSRVMKKIYHQR